MSRAINVTDSHTTAEVRKRLRDLHDSTARRGRNGRFVRSWRSVAGMLGFPESHAAMLARIVRSKVQTQKPPDSVLRALGLPVSRMVEVPDGYGVGEACATCGKVHTTKQCPARRKVRVRRLHELSDEEIHAAFDGREVMR